MDIRDELKKLILEQGIEAEVVNNIHPEWPLMRHVFDSLGYAEFVVAVEERFGIKVSDRYSLRIRSLNDFAGLVAKETAGRQAST
ncbi:MAG: acyl carrier protein [Desulfuromonadaceae bacterium]